MNAEKFVMRDLLLDNVKNCAKVKKIKHLDVVTHTSLIIALERKTGEILV